MKIELDAQEISLVLINWAKDKYHTHNVSVEKLTNTGALIMVTPQDDEFAKSNSPRIEDEKARFDKLRPILKKMEQDEPVELKFGHDNIISEVI